MSNTKYSKLSLRRGSLQAPEDDGTGVVQNIAVSAKYIMENSQSAYFNANDYHTFIYTVRPLLKFVLKICRIFAMNSEG